MLQYLAIAPVGSRRCLNLIGTILPPIAALTRQSIGSRLRPLQPLRPPREGGGGNVDMLAPSRRRLLPMYVREFFDFFDLASAYDRRSMSSIEMAPPPLLSAAQPLEVFMRSMVSISFCF